MMSTQIHMDILKQLKEKHTAEMKQAQTEIKKLKDRCAVQEEKIELLKEILKSRKD